MKISDDLYVFPWQITGVNNCNSYLINGPFKILIDPGHQQLFENLQHSLASIDVSPADIDLVVGTHIHPDHIEAVQSFSSSTMFAMHEIEHNFFLEKATQYYELNREPDFFLTEGILEAGDVEIEVIHTPGHSPGSVCLYWPSHKALFAGDVIFEQGVGRTDLPGGSGKYLKESIKRLSSLDIEWLLPGHGNIISGKDAVMKNFAIIERAYFRMM